MSPRAACRLEALGFPEVYDYVGGKADWLAHGLPVEGIGSVRPRAGDIARDDVATVGLGERVESARERIAASPYGFGLVVSSGGVVLGRLRMSGTDRPPDNLVDDAMEPGPSTVRPDVHAAELRERLVQRDLKTAVVTTPDGVLVGVFNRDDAEPVG